MTTTTDPIDLRSDTVTLPSPEMRQAMAAAEVGDDVYREDPSINLLEERAAAVTGKEAALYVASGSMGNLVSGLSWCARGDEAIVGRMDHILMNEVGSLGTFGGVQIRAVETDQRGFLLPAAVERAIRPPRGFFPRTAMVNVENTQNRGGGAAFTSDEIKSVADVAHAHGVHVHMDGARIFNAAVTTGESVADLAANADSVTFCLSKGLGCPVGSVVCGSSDFIDRARHHRKMLGGGMRQGGVLAAAGLYALDHMVERLAEDHANARRLADGLRHVDGIRVIYDDTPSNMVYMRPVGMPPADFIARLRERGVLCGGQEDWVRMVTHYGINAEDIDEALEAIASAVKSSVAAG